MSNISEKKINVPAIPVTQPIGTFYIASINYNDLIYISEVDVRRLSSPTGQREVEDYIGIQRPLSKNRVKEIGEYVNLIDATFPTSVILHIEPKDIQYKEGILEIAYDKKVAKVLDGQHRIEGLRGCNLPGDKFQLNVTIFVEMELEDQAIVFATINKTHTKVNNSLVADLFAFTKDRSPQKTGHLIARALNQKLDSAFYGKIKILGTAVDKENETITQATFVDSVIKYISGSKLQAMKDRDIYKRGKKLEEVEGKVLNDLFLRNMFIQEKDVEIARLINNYFLAVATKWPSAWGQVRSEMILNRSTGFMTLMRFFKDAYLSFGEIGKIVTREEFSEIFKKVHIKDDELNRDIYLPGGGGQSKLYKELLSQTGLDKS